MLFFLANPVWTFTDAPRSWHVGFPYPATRVMQSLFDLHHDVAFFMLVFLIFVLWLGTRTSKMEVRTLSPRPGNYLKFRVFELASGL